MNEEFFNKLYPLLKCQNYLKSIQIHKNENIDIVNKEKPSGIKGDFILSAYLTSTMGVSFKLKTLR